MLTRYIEVAMEQARFEWLDESGVFYGEIPALSGVWATGATEEECRIELQEVLEDWIALGLSMNHHIPSQPVGGADVSL